MPTYGLWRGLLKSDVLCMQGSSNVNVGDTITIGGNTWTVVSANSFNGNALASTPGPAYQSIHLLVRAT
jgi:hypothetical protein